MATAGIWRAEPVVEMASTPLVIGTRGSPLALRQTDMVVAALRAAVPELRDEGAIRVRTIRTSGDRFLDRPLAEIGGKGLFTKEIEEALLTGAIHLAVHSLKDMPTVLPAGLTLGAVLPRADVRDVLLTRDGADLAALPPGAVVGTSSLRRAAQLRERRPDLRIVPLRGNVGTRLARLQEGRVDATLLARAGLQRLGLDPGPHVVLAPEVMLPAVAQGAIGLECRADDVKTLEFLQQIDHLPSRMCVESERACLAELDGSCRTPIAGLCIRTEGGYQLRALVAAPDGSQVWRASARTGGDPREMGREIGRRLRRAVPATLFDPR